MPNGCVGGWIAATSTGAKNTFAAAMAAKAAANTVSIGLDDSALWSGSSSKYCKVLYITVR